MYQALYRKWRPRTFDDVVGQQHITETLKNQIITDRLSHAYLFIGTRGTGKTTCAKILARAVNCENPVDGNPCNVCRSCQGIESGAIMDVVELDAASNNGVDNVRALRDEAVFSPASVKKRVYIIDEVHMLSISAFNALLKILEEPPEHLMFILATTELHKVPATILSRCQRHSFKRLDTKVVADRLAYVAKKEGLDLESDAAELLGRLADGSMRDGLSLLDQCAANTLINTDTVLSAMGLAGNYRIIQLLDAIVTSDTSTALSLFQGMWSDGKDPSTLLNELAILQRDIVMNIVAPKGGAKLLSGAFDRKTLNSFANRLTSAEYMHNIEAIQESISSMKNSQNPKIVAELCLIGLCEPNLGNSISNLRGRVSKLESMIEKGIPASNVSPPPARVSKPKTAAPQEIVPKSPVISPSDDVPWDIHEEDFKSQDLSQDLTADTPWDDEPNEDTIDWGEPVEDNEEIPWGEDDSENHEEPIANNSSEREEVSFAAQADTDIWQRIVKALKDEIPVGTYSIISDDFHVSGEFTDGVLVLGVKNFFAMGMINKPEITDKIRLVAQKIFGKAIALRVEEYQEKHELKIDKIAELEKFGNFKFE